MQTVQQHQGWEPSGRVATRDGWPTSGWQTTAGKRFCNNKRHHKGTLKVSTRAMGRCDMCLMIRSQASGTPSIYCVRT